MKKHCNSTENIEVAGFFKTKKISILTVEELLKESYPYWLETLIENSTYF